MKLDGGLWVALATPFARDGALDLSAFERLIASLRRWRTDALVVLGSTGEATAIDDDEREALITTALRHAVDLPVVVGCTASATAHACKLAQHAQRLGAHGALIATPPYVKPTQAGIVAHFAAIAAAAPSLPIVAYNIPSRAGVGMTPATVHELFGIPNVCGRKASAGDRAQLAAIAATRPADKLLLAGDDILALGSLAVGAQGLVSVAGNVVPAAMRALVHEAREGRIAQARSHHETLVPLLNALCTESNPIPLKAALALCGLATDTVRLPLLPAQPATRERLRQALVGLGAIA
jgi:4-hydroxy-tetrahydrodipicolinate synthase